MAATALHYDGENEQCCSEGQGTHWTVGDATGNMDSVVKGDLVILPYSGIAGVALDDYDTTLDEVVISLDDCWEFLVRGHDHDGSDTAIRVGDGIYYDADAGELNRDWLNGIYVGLAMEAVASGAEAAICIKFGLPAPWLDIVAMATHA